MPGEILWKYVLVRSYANVYTCLCSTMTGVHWLDCLWAYCVFLSATLTWWVSISNFWLYNVSCWQAAKVTNDELQTTSNTIPSWDHSSSFKVSWWVYSLATLFYYRLACILPIWLMLSLSISNLLQVVNLITSVATISSPATFYNKGRILG